ncbi:trypsin-like serine protease [Flammeovirga sp. SubArs3]|uniref:S1 family peptidase n=1 Tax=Flammeovirga sp. SubArs3 TaxID=2995316 RepID=UPI00248D1CD3|nr:trypsin-like serine protease [Flammeovirga sp. SubArs3]
MNKKTLLFSLFFATIIISCNNDEVETSNDSDEVSTFGIRHDKDLSDYENVAKSNDTSLPNFDAVVNFSYSLDGSSNEDYTASGTLIDTEWILTAGHNFYDANEQSSPAPLEGIKVKIGNNPNNPDAVYSVTEMILHPTWLAGNQEYSHANDLCLIKLSSPVQNITPVLLFADGTESLESTVWFCGFGDYSEQAGQDKNSDSKKHAMSNTLDRKVDGFQTSLNGTTYTGGILAFDFDNPNGTINSLGDDHIGGFEDQLGTGASSASALDYEGATVKGDSGGPLFVKDNGVWKLAGVLAGGVTNPIPNHTDGDYGDISIFIRVSSSYDWILSNME